MRQNDIKQTPEKGVGGKTLSDDYEDEDTEYQYSSSSISPRKNSMRSPDPKKEKGFYGNIYLSRKMKPTNDDESEILENLKTEIDPQQVRKLKDLLRGITSKPIPKVFDRQDLVNTLINLRYARETNTKTGSGLGRRRITGRGSPEWGNSDSCFSMGVNSLLIWRN
jgi:hypothetical protein